MAAKKKKMTFEEGMEELGKLIAGLNEGGLSLDESMKIYEQGVALSRELEQMLGQHKKRVEQIDLETGEISAFEETEHELQ